MTDARFKHRYVGPAMLGMTAFARVRKCAHPKGTSRLERVTRTRIEDASGNVWRVPNAHVVEQSLISDLFARD